MKSVLVAGAGPAGSRLSALLSSKGLDVTLVDRLKSPQQNSFSSAVVPINAINSGLIPSESISTRWNSWQIYEPNLNSYIWSSNNDLGAVLDFSKLRELLWLKATNEGVEILKGWAVNKVNSFNDFAEVDLTNSKGYREKRKFLYVVDATGNSRSIISKIDEYSNYKNDFLLKGFGIEWILQGDLRTSKIWSNRVTFFLGTRWIKHGYGWIFPMGNDQLKVGVCILPPPKFELSSDLTIAKALKSLISRFDLNNLPVLDRHGGIISSSIKRREPHVLGRVIGVGDAVSTANLLGGEGIRHALVSAEILAPLLVSACNCNSSSIKGADTSLSLLKYQRLLSKSLGWQWSPSSRHAIKTWWGLVDDMADKRLSRLIKTLSLKASADEISALLFEYRFERYGLKLLPYLIGWH